MTASGAASATLGPGRPRGAASFPLGRVGTVADVVDAVVFLLSDNAGWITGESLNVDGGEMAG